ncbi:MAG: hypothetical protein JRJ11_16375 [Deltaproteobacteria bacterium]|nr:hypothetical protein [Deltaproteobacteria bacterium]
MAIIASYFGKETYGILGPQMAATVIQENTPYDCVVIAVARKDNKHIIKKALADYFGAVRPIIGFSTLSGRADLFSFAKELKDEGAITILAGPQADVDYLGEKDWQDHSHRFPGLINNFSLSLHGPAEQAVTFLKDLDRHGWKDNPGLLYPAKNGKIIQTPKNNWDEKFLGKVRWDNIFRIGGSGLTPHKITTGQVLQQIGCPYASREKWVEIDYPVSMDGKNGQKVKLLLTGCSFCDVAVDKGFYGALDIETVLSQILCLPDAADGRKIPFELINENPLPGLKLLLSEIRARGISPSQISLILRADWFINGEKHLREALRLARDMEMRIVLASVGFESFDNRILGNLNKGLNVETNIKAIRLMRQIKEEFPREWGYSRAEGAIHGFIHPTPWDTEETSDNMQEIIARYALAPDILPDHSIPLIIHHASGLGDWIREVETREQVRFKRHVSIIGWWQQGDRFTL